MKEIKSVLSDLTKLTKLATQGKWRACGQDCNTLCRCGRIWSVTEDKPVAEVLASGRLEEEIAHPKNWQENAKYISAACPENISMLLSYIEQLQARIKELESDKHVNEIKANAIIEAINCDMEYIEHYPIPRNYDYGMTILRLNTFAEKLRTNHD